MSVQTLSRKPESWLNQRSDISVGDKIILKPLDIGNIQVIGKVSSKRRDITTFISMARANSKPSSLHQKRANVLGTSEIIETNFLKGLGNVFRANINKFRVRSNERNQVHITFFTLELMLDKTGASSDLSGKPSSLPREIDLIKVDLPAPLRPTIPYR